MSVPIHSTLPLQPSNCPETSMPALLPKEDGRPISTDAPEPLAKEMEKPEAMIDALAKNMERTLNNINQFDPFDDDARERFEGIMGLIKEMNTMMYSILNGILEASRDAGDMPEDDELDPKDEIVVD